MKTMDAKEIIKEVTEKIQNRVFILCIEVGKSISDQEIIPEH